MCVDLQLDLPDLAQIPDIKENCIFVIVGIVERADIGCDDGGIEIVGEDGGDEEAKREEGGDNLESTHEKKEHFVPLLCFL